MPHPHFSDWATQIKVLCSNWVLIGRKSKEGHVMLEVPDGAKPTEGRPGWYW